MTISIWWVRRDLRLTDNQALHTALKLAGQVLPVFVLDPLLINSNYAGPKRLAFLYENLRHLDTELQSCGSRLLVRRGDPLAQLSAVAEETGAAHIVAEEDYSPYARRRDAKIASRLPLHLVNGLTVHHPTTVLKDDGQPYTVFTPFSKTWKSLPAPTADALLPTPSRIPTPGAGSGQAIPAEPALPAASPFPPGPAEARQRLEKFVAGSGTAAAPIFSYADSRNRMDLNGTSQLSPYLRFGVLSARQVAVAARQAIDTAPTAQAEKGAVTWLNELIWREFYQAILYHFPRVRAENFQQKYNGLRWNNDEKAFDAWRRGRTGYPVVDAAMRQLTQTGWMHNRARMIVASFLVKDLLIDWRWGERWFMQHLVDGDPAANNGGWQWTAGTGTDAAPYFRVFNPILQGEKFDPDGSFIRRWLPELKAVPAQYIHTPWQMSSRLQQQAGCIIGRDYPEPIIDHQRARKRTLTAYQQV